MVENATPEQVAEFEMIMYRCMWERDHNAEAKDIKTEQLMAYK